MRIPISRVRSITMVCIFKRTTRKLTTIPSATMVRVKGRNCGKFDELISVTYSDKERTLLSGINLRICARVPSVSPLLLT